HRRVGVRTKESVRQASASRDGDRGQGPVARDVAHRIDALNVGVLVSVDANEAVVVQSNTQALQAETSRRRMSTDGPYQLVETVHLAAVDRRHSQQAGFGSTHTTRFRIGMHDDAYLDQAFHQVLAQDRVEVVKNVIVARKQAYASAEQAQNARKLDANVARADHRHVFRLFRQLKEAVGRDAQLRPWDLWNARIAARRDQHVRRRQRATVDLDLAGLQQARPPADLLYP